MRLAQHEQWSAARTFGTASTDSPDLDALTGFGLLAGLRGVTAAGCTWRIGHSDLLRHPGDDARLSRPQVGFRSAVCAADQYLPVVEIYPDQRRRAVVLIVTENEFDPASLDGVPGAGIEDGLELIQADRMRGTVTATKPRQPAPAVQPQAGPVQSGQQDQPDSQPGNRHEKKDGHAPATRRAYPAFPERRAFPAFRGTPSDRAAGSPATKSP